MRNLLFLLLISTSLYFACGGSDGPTETDSVDSTAVTTDSSAAEEKPTRRRTLLNSSEKIVKEHNYAKKRISSLRKERSEYKAKKQTKGVKEKIARINELIGKRTQELIFIERADIAADDIPTANRARYSEINHKIFKIRKDRSAYSHRKDARADEARADLTKKIRALEREMKRLE